MHRLIRPVLTALGIACAAASFASVTTNSALAQAGGAPPLKQVALTDKQIDGVIAAQKEMNPITEKLAPNAKPDPKVLAQLESVAKKNGFASYDEFSNVMDNIGLVMGGIPPRLSQHSAPDPGREGHRH